MTEVPDKYRNEIYEPPMVEIVKEREKVEMFYDQGYWPILVILREGSLTVSEITQKSNELIEKRVMPELDKKFTNYEVTLEKLQDSLTKVNTFTKAEKQNFDEKIKKNKPLTDAEKKLIIKRIKEYKLSKEQKSEKTIYRYMKDLKAAGLVVPAGFVNKPDQTASETLFSRKAKIFILRQHSDDTWRCDECKTILRKVSKMLALSMQIDEPDVECLANLMSATDMYMEDEQIRLFEEYEEEMQELVKDCSFEESNKMLKTFHTIYMLLKAEEFQDELKDCFK